MTNFRNLFCLCMILALKYHLACIRRLFKTPNGKIPTRSWNNICAYTNIYDPQWNTISGADYIYLDCTFAIGCPISSSTRRVLPHPARTKLIDYMTTFVCLFSEELRSQFFVVHNKVGPINNRHQASGFINRCKLSLPYPIGSKLTYARKKARLTDVICCLKTRETSIAIRHGTKRNSISAEESHETGYNIQGVVFFKLVASASETSSMHFFFVSKKASVSVKLDEDMQPTKPMTKFLVMLQCLVVSEEVAYQPTQQKAEW